MLFVLSLLGIAGCSKPTEEGNLSDTGVTATTGEESIGVIEDEYLLDLEVTETIWGGGAKIVGEERGFDEIKVGDIISDTLFGTIKVTKVTKEELVLGFEGAFVERGDTGINLRAEPLTEFSLQEGDTVRFSSQSMDAGVTVTVTFH